MENKITTKLKENCSVTTTVGMEKSNTNRYSTIQPTIEPIPKTEEESKEEKTNMGMDALVTVVGIYAEQQEKMRRVGKAMTSFVDLLPPLGIFSAGFSMIPILIV